MKRTIQVGAVMLFVYTGTIGILFFSDDADKSFPSLSRIGDLAKSLVSQPNTVGDAPETPQSMTDGQTEGVRSPFPTSERLGGVLFFEDRISYQRGQDTQVNWESEVLGESLASNQSPIIVNSSPTIIERIIREVAGTTTVISQGGVSRQHLQEQLDILDNSLRSEIYRVSANNSGPGTYTPSVSNFSPIALSNKIDRLDDATLSNTTFSGTVTGLSSIIGLGDYLPLTGGTLTGALIGTSATLATLSVTASTTFNGIEYLFPSSGGSNTQVLTTDGAGGLSWSTASSLGAWTSASGNTTLNTGADLVGIGTTTPYAKLSVHGLSNASDTSKPLFVLASSTASATTTLFSVSNTGDTVVAGDVRPAVGKGITDADGDTGIEFEATSDADNIVFNVQGAELLTVTSQAWSFDTTSAAAPDVEYTFSGSGTGGSSGTFVEIVGDDLGLSSYAAGLALHDDSASGNRWTVAVWDDNFVLNTPKDLTIASETGGGLLHLMDTGFYGFSAGTAPGDLGARITLSLDGESDDAFHIDSNDGKGGDVFNIEADGDVGISTTTPYAKLSVHGPSNASDTSRPLFVVASSTASATTTLLTIANTGDATFTGTGGTCTITGSGACSSDIKVKTDINDLPSVILDEIKRLRPITYRLSKYADRETVHLGFIAQEVQEVFPEVVTELNDSVVGRHLGLRYERLIVPAIKAIQELDEKVEALASGVVAGASAQISNVVELIADSISSTSLYVRERFVVGSPEKPVGITLYDPSGDAYCVQLAEGGAIESIEGECNEGAIPLDSVGPQADPELSGTSSSADGANTPIITISGNNPATINSGSQYVDLGAYCRDTEDGELFTDSEGSVNTEEAGEYTITYTCMDSDLNTTEAARIVNVVDPNAQTEEEPTPEEELPTPVEDEAGTPTPEDVGAEPEPVVEELIVEETTEETTGGPEESVVE